MPTIPTIYQPISSLFHLPNFTSQQTQFISSIQPIPLTFLRFLCIIASFYPSFCLFLGVLLPGFLVFGVHPTLLFIYSLKFHFFLHFHLFTHLSFQPYQYSNIWFRHSGTSANTFLGWFQQPWLLCGAMPLDHHIPPYLIKKQPFSSILTTKSINNHAHTVNNP